MCKEAACVAPVRDSFFLFSSFYQLARSWTEQQLESDSAAAAIPLLSVRACDVVLMLGATSPRLPQSVACVRAG